MLYGTNNTITNSFFNSTEERMLGSATILLELLMIRDGLTKLTSGVFSSAELKRIID
jgi:hypothetical protein